VAVVALAARALGGALDLVLPPRCLGCGGIVERQGRLCAGCWRGLTFLAAPLCRSCGYPLPGAAAADPLCGGCTLEPPAFGRARAALRYDEGARGLILAFKHADRTDSAPAFGRWLARAGSGLLAEADLIAPVPLHWTRLLRRRYNQSAELARHLARAAGRPFAGDLLTRRRATAPQQGGRDARAANQSGAFALTPRRAAEVAGRRVLLVDDVLTSGATLSACADCLLDAGAAGVDVLALARVAFEDSLGL
jgi:ComF family protein